MARKTNRSNQRLAIEDSSAGLPKARKQKADVTLAEAIAQQADEEGKTEEEVKAELHALPPADERPVKPAGTSNLALTIRNHRHRYLVMLHPNGKKTQNNGDPVAIALLNVPLAELKDLGSMRFDGRRYDHLNDGHARMCIGNLIRAEYKKGTPDMVEWVQARLPKEMPEGEEEEAA